jgi:hypothetical protein
MLLIVRHRVRDFDAWKPVFDEHQPLREQHGGRRHWVYRSLDDPNDLTVSVEFASRDQAERFVAHPSLREAMSRAGVEGTPDFSFVEESETRTY